MVKKQKIKNWLKSLKNRYAWKPSNEQIEALETFLYDDKNDIKMPVLESLYDDLMKLKYSPPR